MKRRPKPERYSIAEARQMLPRLVHRVEAGKPVEITRRGKPVAALVSLEAYARLGNASRRHLGDVIRDLRKEIERNPELALEPEDWLPPRDRSPGPEFHW